MSVVRFVGDEHVDHDLADALWHVEPAIEIVFVGEDSAPRAGSSDQEIIQFCERSGLALLTMDRNTLLKDLNEHWADGRHSCGVFLIDPEASWRRLIDDLISIWSASAAEDWRDVVEYLPW